MDQHPSIGVSANSKDSEAQRAGAGCSQGLLCMAVITHCLRPHSISGKHAETTRNHNSQGSLAAWQCSCLRQCRGSVPPWPGSTSRWGSTCRPDTAKHGIQRRKTQNDLVSTPYPHLYEFRSACHRLGSHAEGVCPRAWSNQLSKVPHPVKSCWREPHCTQHEYSYTTPRY